MASDEGTGGGHAATTPPGLGGPEGPVAPILPTGAEPPPAGTASALEVHARPRRRRTVLTVGALVAGAVAAAVAVPLTTGGGQSSSGAVADAVASTLTARTADVTFNATVQAAGTTVYLTGTGQADFAGNAMSLAAGATEWGHRTTLNEIVVNGTLYLGVPGLSTVEPGKTWVSLDVSAIQGSGASTLSPGAVGTANNPVAILRTLERAGGTVQQLGASTQGGTAVTGYRVVLDGAELAAQAAKEHLPEWLRQAESTIALTGMTLTVYVATTGLLHSMDIKTSASESGTPVVADETLAFSTFGTAVTVEAPSSTTVITMQQFLQATAGLGTEAQT
jgi:hypothetical protein